MNMKKNLLAVAALCAALATPAFANTQGSAGEAKAMLQKVVSSLKADKSKTLGQISLGENGFRDRDLYPFCGGPDGNFTAHPQLSGKSMKTLKGQDGEPLGMRLYDSAKENEINEIEYKWPKPGAKEPVTKVSYVTKVGDQVCAVGYYK
jgi:signal transduction histidine kinase